MGVIAVFFVDLLALLETRLRPSRLFAGHAHGDDGELAVIALPLAAGHSIETEDLTGSFQISRCEAACEKLVLCGVVVFRFVDRNRVLWIGGKVQTDVVADGVGACGKLLG